MEGSTVLGCIPGVIKLAAFAMHNDHCTSLMLS